MNKNDGLIIIPTYNEEENISALLNAILKLPIQFDVLIIDDNSQDKTIKNIQHIIKEYPNRVSVKERAEKLGLGSAYTHGFKWALTQHYNYFLEMDADFSHNPNDLCKLYQACKSSTFDLAIGSRYKNGVNVINWPMSRLLLSYFGSKYVKLITGLPINDTTSGFKCYRRNVLEAIDFDKIQFQGYGFQIAMKHQAWKAKFKLTEIPITFTERQLGQSKMSANIIKEALVGVWKLRFFS